MTEADFMRRAVALAWRSAGHTRPNPPVGAVVVKGGKIQLNLHDGRNILLDKDQYKTGDVLQVSFENQKILGSFALESGAAALVSAGNHAGTVDTVSEYEVIKGPSENVVKFKSGTETVKSNVFVIGTGSPAITMPEAEN